MARVQGSKQALRQITKQDLATTLMAMKASNATKSKSTHQHLEMIKRTKRTTII